LTTRGTVLPSGVFAVCSSEQAVTNLTSSSRVVYLDYGDTN
jgi:hypothetical protein